MSSVPPRLTAACPPLRRVRRRGWRRAFTLVEVMIAMGLFSGLSVLVYQCFGASFVLAAKNTALNHSNRDLQNSYARLLTTLESAAMLVDCANFDPATGKFTEVAKGSWGNSVRFMRPFPATFYILPDDSSGYTVTNPPPTTRSVTLSSTTKTVRLAYNSSLYSVAGLGTDARFFPTFPNVTENLSTGTSPGSAKPGLAIAAIDTSTPGIVVLTLVNTLGTNAPNDCNRAYLLVESAFTVTAAADGGKNLLHFARASATSNPTVICRSLDGANQSFAADSSIPAGGTAGSFSMTAGVDAVQTLLPVRARGDFNLLSRRGGPTGQNSTWININTRFRQRQDL